MYRETLPVLIIVLMFALAFYAGPLVATNQNGQMKAYFGLGGGNGGWIDKGIGLYLLPIIALIIYLSLLVIPKIEVYQENLADFRQQFWGFKVILAFVMCAIYLAILLPALGFWKNVDPVWVIVPAISLLFFYVGYMLNFTKRNYFIGVRTPWTLADEKIWDKTNRLAGRLFWICGVLTIVSLVSPSDVRLWIILLPVVLAAIIAWIYSLVEYRKAKKAGSERQPRQKGRKRK